MKLEGQNRGAARANTRFFRIPPLMTLVALAAFAQNPGAVFLEVEFSGGRQYWDDLDSPAQAATVQERVIPRTRPFQAWVFLADIARVNGKPAKGIFISKARQLTIRTSPTPGQAIGDVNRDFIFDNYVEILQEDGAPIGTIVTSGAAIGPPPPGSPAIPGIAQNMAITGGTGSYVGVRGYAVLRTPFLEGGVGGSSMIESATGRRETPGARFVWIYVLYPMTRPEVWMGTDGAGVLHSDFAPITQTNPARPGELLIARARNLGPVRANLMPGQVFPADPPAEVNSPIEVKVDGREAAVINKVGWPGTDSVYRIDFRVPEGTPSGMAALQLSAAWVTGPEVQIPIR